MRKERVMPRQKKPYSQLKKGPQKRTILTQAKRVLDTLGRGEGHCIVEDLLQTVWGRSILEVRNNKDNFISFHQIIIKTSNFLYKYYI